ncbi:MAG: cation:proton antiporter [Clostridia bacterium]|nr:cation:proton antiporter [Clostridia bacterium]
MEITTLLAIGFCLVAGLLLSRLMKLLNLPNVTGYLIAGLLIGPYVSKLVSKENLEALSVITEVALGFIAFSIGGEFKLTYMKKIGGKLIGITLMQALCATAFVTIALLFIPGEHRVPQALVLGAIASATAPAATLMVVRQYKSKGAVTDTLLPVVAFDDAVGLILFSVCFSLAGVFATGAELTFKEAVWKPLFEIIKSLVAGGAIGALLALCMRFFRSRGNRLCLMITAVIIGVALASSLEMSSLLTCMMIGAVFANMRKDAINILENSDRWTPPLFMLFFVVSGAQLDLSVLMQAGLVGVVYIVFRSLGKYLGSYWGSALAKADPKVKKYLGITLLPQAGVAIGMAQVVSKSAELAEFSSQIVTVVLFATLVYELIGPILTKAALMKAGEIEAANSKFRLTFDRRSKKVR